jgi:hypothetical protein
MTTIITFEQEFNGDIEFGTHKSIVATLENGSSFAKFPFGRIIKNKGKLPPFETKLIMKEEFFKFQVNVPSLKSWNKESIELKASRVICGNEGQKLIPIGLDNSIFELLAEEMPIIIEARETQFGKNFLLTVDQVVGEKKARLWKTEVKTHEKLGEFVPKKLKFLEQAILACAKKFKEEIEIPIFITE